MLKKIEIHRKRTENLTKSLMMKDHKEEEQ